MTVTRETAQSISNTLVRVMKVVTAMKSRMPMAGLVPVAGLDHSHVPTLFTLAHEPRRVSQLAEMIHSDISTVSRQVSHLVQIGLVEKIGDPDDRRAQLLSLSPTGREVIDELVTRRGEWFEVLLKNWSERDAATFLCLLERFGDSIETYKTDLTTAGHATAAHDATHELAHASAAGGPIMHTNTHTNQEH